tara:strand:- start:312 stop:599 length:288 start_codon:yes stop_codon:yes gene_type:complete
VAALKPPHFTNRKIKMRNFLVNIWAYDYHAKFKVLAEDNAPSIEKSILDKLGEKSIKWESTGMFRDIPNRITYEEVIDVTRPIQTKKVLGVEVAV